MNRSLIRWAALLLAASPALLLLVLILQHAVDMPYWDHWNRFTAGLYIKVHQGQLTLHDLLALQNEHRPVVPRLFYLALNVFTHWNTKLECLLEWLFVCVASSGMLGLFCLTERKRSPGAAAGAVRGRVLVLWFVCNLLLFSPAQWENWLWGMGLVNIMPMPWITLALVVIAAELRPWPTVIAAMLLSSAATYSNACGLFYWPLIAALLAWSGSRAELASKRRILAAYGIWAVINMALYFVGYARPTHGGAELYSTNPSKLFVYFLAFSGNMFSGIGGIAPTTAATIAGSFMMVLLLASMAYFMFVWLSARDYELCRRLLFWLVVAWMTVLNAALSSFGRAGPGAGGAVSSRYVTLALFLPVGLVFLVPLVCEDVRSRSWRTTAPWLSRVCIQVPAVLGAAVVLLSLMVLPGALASFNDTEMLRRQGKGALLLLDALPDNPQLTAHVCAEIDLITSQAPVLNRMGYLHPPLIAGNDASRIQGDPASVGGLKGQLERMGRTETNKVGFSGWAVFPAKSAPADAVFLTYENERREPIIFALAEIGRRRDDVVSKERNPDYLLCGWVAVVPQDRLPRFPATMTITAWALDTDTGKAFKLDGAKTVEL